MATFIPVTNIPTQFVDNNGDTLVGGSLEFFEGGTSTPTDLYTSDGTSIGTSVELNAWGYPESGGMAIFLFRDQSKALKIVVKNAAGAVVGPTIDLIPAVASFDATSSAKLDLITVTTAVDLNAIETTANAALPLAGGTMTGDINMSADIVMGAGKFLVKTVTSGIAASVTQTQAGGTPLTSRVNEVATVTSANDAVTMRAAVTGISQTIINNGANTMGIFPASGDDNGSGVDTVTTLASGSSVTFEAYDTTNWAEV